MTHTTHINYKLGCGFWKLPIIIQSFKLTNHRVVPMILWVVASMVTLANARHWYNLEWLESVCLAKTERIVFEGLILQTSKLGKHRVVPMVGGVLASLVPPTNTRHWYNLVWLTIWLFDKIERFVFGVQIWKSWGSAYDWVVPATLCVTAPNCQVHKMAQPNWTRKCRFSKFWFTHQQENQKITNSREFGPVD